MLMTSGDQTPVAGSGRSETAGTDAGTGQAVMAAWQVLGPLIDLVTPMALRVAATLRLPRPLPRSADAGTGQAVMAAWQVLGPLIDLVTPMALRVAATLRLADFMPDDGTGEGTVLGDLAERAGADPEVFTEPRPGQFAANQTAALLRTGQPGAVWLDLDGFGGRMDLAFTGLVHTVRTGKPAWE